MFLNTPLAHNAPLTAVGTCSTRASAPEPRPTLRLSRPLIIAEKARGSRPSSDAPPPFRSVREPAESALVWLAFGDLGVRSRLCRELELSVGPGGPGRGAPS